MLLLIFQSVQQVSPFGQQVTPNVYVTLQSAPMGMPEWVKILLSATVGALVGIISNIAMEYVKPWIVRRGLRKSVATQLVSEWAVNYSKIESGVRVLAKVDATLEGSEDNAMAIAEAILLDIDMDRYEFNFANNKSLVYEIDPKNRITTAYRALKTAKTGCEKLSFSLAKASFKMASEQTQLFFRELSIPLKATVTVFDKLSEVEEQTTG